ncbi:neuropeptide FF receptor 2-like [Argiope bruennichi]|uniref:neuropeptide FF receptor 2-like n=1 Tax=Argiope bruennichi TaxID=94029 RepID=UPI0024953519|nr:neuropeptide FF receptor 2-like [Argiope bruennichi]
MEFTNSSEDRGTIFDFESAIVNMTDGIYPLDFNTTLNNRNRQKGYSLPSDAPLIICLYSSIFILSVVGNALVILTLAQNKRMRTVTNVFLLNLAISDLLLGVFCMPFTLIGSLLRNFIFGEVVCRLINYFQASHPVTSKLSRINRDYYDWLLCSLTIQLMDKKYLQLLVNVLMKEYIDRRLQSELKVKVLRREARLSFKNVDDVSPGKRRCKPAKMTSTLE